VATFLGYMMEEDKRYSILSEWAEKGSLRQCLDASKSTMPANQLLAMSSGIAKGVCYLHDKFVVHADLKAANVLVSRSGEPLLADFGVSRMTESVWSKGFYTTETSRHSTRWLPYEYYHIDESETFHPDPMTDVWAFGMTLLELLTLKVPFEHIKNEGALRTAIMNQALPTQPIFEGSDAPLKNDMWSLCRKCWNKRPESRPSMQGVLRELIRINYRHGRS